MSFIRRLTSSVLASRTCAAHFPEENLLSITPQDGGFFITSPGALLKDGRYKIIRKLGRGRCSNAFLVEDLRTMSSSLKYLAVKILTVDATNALQQGIICETDFLNAIAERFASAPEPPLPMLHDHFAQRGPHGVHYCLLTPVSRSHVHAFRASAPTEKLAVHIVKPIIACVVEGLKAIHALDIIHADIKADNILLLGPDTTEIEETVAKEPTLVDGTFELEGTKYPILRSQPFRTKISWDASPFMSETIQVVLSDLGSGLWANKPKPSGDIGALGLRAPENLIRSECGKEIDIWAVGCMTYELLTGQILFRPQPTDDLTVDESLLLLQYALTGETLNGSVVEKARLKDQYFDGEGNFAKGKMNPYPRQTLSALLDQHTDLHPVQIEAAASFVRDCLRLNPSDRLTVDQLDEHRWFAGQRLPSWEVLWTRYFRRPVSSSR